MPHSNKEIWQEIFHIFLGLLIDRLCWAKETRVNGVAEKMAQNRFMICTGDHSLCNLNISSSSFQRFNQEDKTRVPEERALNAATGPSPLIVEFGGVPCISGPKSLNCPSKIQYQFTADK
ncbi:hypothetical protein Ciccas_000482 [Cichlidogyrus casuarinus]|uniref:Uncharacterized protein n=1 Tax=Cichlidogyrus casuarinus TaxID=1844966 RepID=A0ABD2QN41_9PLAT